MRFQENKENPFQKNHVQQTDKEDNTSHNSQIIPLEPANPFAYSKNSNKSLIEETPFMNNENKDPNLNQGFPQSKKNSESEIKPSSSNISLTNFDGFQKKEDNVIDENFGESQKWKFKKPEYQRNFSSINNLENASQENARKYKKMITTYNDLTALGYEYIEPKKLTEFFQIPPKKEEKEKNLNLENKENPPVIKRSPIKNEKIKTLYNFEKYRNYVEEIAEGKENSSLKFLPDTSQTNATKDDYKKKFLQLKEQLDVISNKINSVPPQKEEDEEVKENPPQSEKESEIKIRSLQNIDRKSNDISQDREENHSFVHLVNEKENNKTKNSTENSVKKNDSGFLAQSVQSLMSKNDQRQKETFMIGSERAKNQKRESSFAKAFSLNDSNLRTLETQFQNNGKKIDIKKEIENFERKKESNEKLLFVHDIIENILNEINYAKIPNNMVENEVYYEKNQIEESKNQSFQKDFLPHHSEINESLNLNEKSLTEVNHPLPKKDLSTSPNESNLKPNYLEILSKINSSKNFHQSILKEKEVIKANSQLFPMEYKKIDLEELKANWNKRLMPAEKKIEGPKPISFQNQYLSFKKNDENPPSKTFSAQIPHTETDLQLAIHSLKNLTEKGGTEQNPLKENTSLKNEPENSDRGENDLKNVKELIEENEQNFRISNKSNKAHDYKSENNSVQNFRSEINNPNDILRSFSLKGLDNDPMKNSKIGIESKISFFQKESHKNSTSIIQTKNNLKIDEKEFEAEKNLSHEDLTNERKNSEIIRQSANIPNEMRNIYSKHNFLTKFKVFNKKDINLLKHIF